ncbi:MAG: FkbM family methyltransferase [Candidatus Heimdallarchaeota archaeon]|nr:FkbM family methyltransferase [Candidatus Heimdallarchaeota archaeon]
MLIKIYRLLSNKGIARFVPEKIMFKVHKLILKLSKNIVMIKFNNKKMFIIKDYSHDLIFRKKFLEPETTKLFLEISKNYDLFVDVGSCFGYYTLLSEAKNNIAIEPDKKNFRLLEKTIEKNKMNNTTLFNYAISNKNEERIFYKTKLYSYHSLRNEHLKREEVEITGEEIVETKTLDTLLKPFLNQKMLFKIDIEGLEAEAFEGMKNLLSTKNIDIIFEYNIFRYTQKDLDIIHKIVKDNFDILYLGVFKNVTKKMTFEELLKIEEDYCNIFLQQKKD